MTLIQRLGAAAAGLCLLATPAFAAAPEPAAVMTAMERVADWQIANPVPPKVGRRDPKGWEQGAFYVGLTHLADRSASPRFKAAILAHGAENNWQLGRRLYHADDHVIGAAYLWAAKHGAPAAATAHIRSQFDAVLKTPAVVHLSFVGRPGQDAACVDRWCWCDALFMGPPTWLGLANQTENRAYADFAHAEFKAAADFLYDPQEKLFFRDSRFFERRGEHGEKVFWSRGNGWVFAGLARILDELPARDPHRAYYEHLFKEMAPRLKGLQKADGYWSPSLLAGREDTPAETSGTGFYVYGLAWGVNHGLLDRDEYAPAIEKGWDALTRAVHPDGMLGWVQQVSDQPDKVAYEDTQFYGTGAFLLAGSEVYDLYRKRAK